MRPHRFEQIETAVWSDMAKIGDGSPELVLAKKDWDSMAEIAKNVFVRQGGGFANSPDGLKVSCSSSQAKSNT